MDNKKVVNTQHVKHNETLSRAQNISPLNRFDGSVDGTVDNTGFASNTADNYPVGGVSLPSTPSVAEPAVAELWKACRHAQLTSASYLVESEIFCPLLLKL